MGKASSRESPLTPSPGQLNLHWHTFPIHSSDSSRKTNRSRSPTRETLSRLNIISLFTVGIASPVMDRWMMRVLSGKILTDYGFWRQSLIRFHLFWGKPASSEEFGTARFLSEVNATQERQDDTEFEVRHAHMAPAARTSCFPNVFLLLYATWYCRKYHPSAKHSSSCKMPPVAWDRASDGWHWIGSNIARQPASLITSQPSKVAGHVTKGKVAQITQKMDLRIEPTQVSLHPSKKRYDQQRKEHWQTKRGHQTDVALRTFCGESFVKIWRLVCSVDRSVVISLSGAAISKGREASLGEKLTSFKKESSMRTQQRREWIVKFFFFFTQSSYG